MAVDKSAGAVAAVEQGRGSLVPYAFHRPTALEIMFDERLFTQASRVASMMAGARGAIPKHLIGCPEACFAVVVMAMTTGMNPYMIATSSYQTPGGRIGYEGKLIHAILELSHKFKDDRITYEHYGPWERVQGKFTNAVSKHKDSEGNDKYYAKRTWSAEDAKDCGVRVIGHVEGELEPRVYKLDLVQCMSNMNSTLWASDPKTQICYRAVRGFGNLAAPSIMMGIPDETAPATLMPGDDAIDVTEPARPQIDNVAQPSEPTWFIVDNEGEEQPFRTCAGAVSAMHKVLAAAMSIEELVTVWDNNAPFFVKIGFIAEREELQKTYDDLRARWRPAPNPMNAPEPSTAPPAAPPEPPPTGATSAEPGPGDDEPRTTAGYGGPPDMSREDEAFWNGESLAVAVPMHPKQRNVPDYKMWPLMMGPRVRQAWTVALVDELAKDNAATMRLFEEAMGEQMAGDLKQSFADRRRDLTGNE